MSVRSMRMKDFDAEVGRFFEVYNAAWSRNWGFAPMPEAEIRHLGKQLKQILDPDLALVVEKADGEPIAVALTLPDVNEVMRNIRSGRLLPLGWLKLLRGPAQGHPGQGLRPRRQARAPVAGPRARCMYQEILDRLRAKPDIQAARGDRGSSPPTTG